MSTVKLKDQWQAYVVDDNISKYPQNGVQGDYWYILEAGIPSWANGTDEQIVQILQWAYDNSIDLSQYWSVGDERVVSLSSMAATGVGETHAAQDVTLVLMNKGGKTLSDGTTECQFIVGQKELLNYSASTLEGGYMNNIDTNSGGWSSSARRVWCNAVYYAAIPTTLQSIFKQFSNTTGVGGGATSGLRTTTDYFALPADKEVFGVCTHSQTDEAAALSQFTYYATSANRIKYYASGSAYNWWERSPYSSNSNNFCDVSSTGTIDSDSANYTCGLAPFGVI